MFQWIMHLFLFLLEFEIGIQGKEGADLFSVEVCTPQWLLNNHQTIDIVLGNYKMIVFEYNIDNIINVINQKLNSQTYQSWEEAVHEIRKIAHWEFDDYKP